MDFSDQEFVQEIEFLSKNKYYITSLNCKLKLKEYINEDEKIKKLSAKSRLLLKKGAAYLCTIDYLTLRSTCYVKKSIKLINLNSGRISFTNIVTNINFGIQQKKNRDCQIYSPFSHFIGNGFTFERALLKGLNLIVRLTENQTHIESFFLLRSPSSGTENISFVLGCSYYRDINLYFVYDKQNKQWFPSGTDFFNEAICEKVSNRSFILREFGKNCYHTKKKGNGYAIGHVDQR